MSLQSLILDFTNEIEKQQNILVASSNPKYQQSVILDRLIWNQEKILKGDEKLPFTQQQAYLAAKIPQYFLR